MTEQRWTKKIAYLQKNNRPVYVETDPGTGTVTRVCMPEVARVWQITDADEKTVKISFHTSSAFHYLHRDRPGFQKMLDALETAKDTNSLILVTSTPAEFEIIAVSSMPASLGNKEVEHPEPKPIVIKPVSLERAKELFDLMQEKTCTPGEATGTTCIPFKYPSSGCWVRAHLMCYLMMDLGETPEKVWNDGNLHACTSNAVKCIVHWPWHVAPTLMVKQEGKENIKMVLDPSMFNEPVTVEEWRSQQNDKNSKLRETSWLQFDHYSGTATQAEADAKMEDFRAALDEVYDESGPPPYDCPKRPK